MEVDEAVKNLNGSEEEKRELAKEIAKDNIKTANSMKKLQKTFKDYSDVLKKGDKTSFEYAKAMNAIKTEVTDLLGVDLGDDWFNTEENLELVKEMSNGSIDALKQLRV
jgi:hypothetical protein